MSLTQTEIVDQAEVELKDTGNSIWLAADLILLLQNSVLKEVTKRQPKRNKTALVFDEYTKNIDISGLSNLIKVIAVEYPVDYEPIRKKNWDYLDDAADIIKVNLGSVPAIDDGTLTGDVTFTQNSRSVSGSGTTFNTELSEGDFICVSTASKYYRVVKITSATALTLERAFAESTVAPDTTDSTKYVRKSSVAYVYWGGHYTVGASSSDAPESFDDVLVAGLVYKAIGQVATSKINKVNIGEAVAQFYLSQYDRRRREYQDLLNGLGRIEDDIVEWLPKGAMTTSDSLHVWNIG